MGNDKLKRGFDLESETYDKYRNQEYFMQNVRILENLLEGRNGKVLEIGCGTGMYVKEFRNRGYEMVGVDYSEKMCAIARKNVEGMGNPQEIIKHSDAEESLGFEDVFSAIVVMDCWEFFPNPSRVIQNVYNSLMDDGMLVIITVNPWFAPVIVLCEHLRIKKNRPAFHYYNSFQHRTKRMAMGFSLVNLIKTYWGMKYLYVFKKNANNLDRVELNSINTSAVSCRHDNIIDSKYSPCWIRNDLHKQYG